MYGSICNRRSLLSEKGHAQELGALWRSGRYRQKKSIKISLKIDLNTVGKKSIGVCEKEIIRRRVLRMIRGKE